MNFNWKRAARRWGMWESMQPGGFFGNESINCPYCDTGLNVEVSNRYGTDAYCCCECDGEFEIDWREGLMTFYTYDNEGE